MAKKFIKGTFEIDKDVVDVKSYEQDKTEKVTEIIDWCWSNSVGISVEFGTAEDNTYLCEYKIVGMTKAQCNETLRDLKKRLRGCFPYVKMLLQISGDCL